MSEAFWLAVLHVMMKLRILKPYLTLIDYIVSKAAEVEEP
jgi:hypothetical protein